jgi:aminoglycoside/choline kinase family phosphotransferase
VRDRRLGYYEGEMKAGRSGFDEKAFRETLLGCRLQRHMQALGAYGFLAEVKGKKYFLKHVPEALALLRADMVEARRDYPELERLIASL